MLFASCRSCIKKKYANSTLATKVFEFYTDISNFPLKFECK